MKTALKDALLKAGVKPSQYRKPEPRKVVVVEPDHVVHSKPRDDKLILVWLKRDRRLGFKPKAQVQTLRDNVWPYVVPKPRKAEKREEPPPPSFRRIE